MLLTLACAFLACTQSLPTAPDAVPLLSQATGDITVAYECGNTFLFHNRSLDTMTLSWRVRGVHEEGTVFLAARPASAEYSETRVTTSVQGPLQVFKGGRELLTVPNGHGPVCAVSDVPNEPPDTVPAWVFADTNAVTSPDFGTAKIPKNVVMVSFYDGVTIAEKRAIFDSVGGTLIGGDNFGGGRGFYYIRIPGAADGVGLMSAVHRLRGMPKVLGVAFLNAPIATQWVKPVDGTGWSDWSPSVEGASGSNWGPEAIAAPLAWGCSTGSPQTKLAVVDHGFTSQPDIDLNVTYTELTDRFPIAIDHGTRVASIAGARGADSLGISGIAWNVDLRLYDGAAEMQGTVSAARMGPTSVAWAVLRAGRGGAAIVNLSWSADWTVLHGQGYVPHTSVDSEFAIGTYIPFKTAVFTLQQENHTPLIVVAAGQGSTNDFFSGVAILKDNFPDRVLVVGGVELNGRQIMDWSHSNRGARTTVVAPAVDVGSISGSGLNTTATGTSFAAPLVSGLAALVLSQNPLLTPAQVIEAIDSGAVRGGRFFNGVPLVNAYETLKYVARTPNTPLCGNRIAIEGRNIVAERAPGSFATLATITNTSRIDRLLTFHGGRKFVVRNEGEDKVFEMQSNGSWAGGQLWDRDSTDLTGSAVSQYGEDHDRQGVYHVIGETLWHGKTFFDATTPVTTLDPAPGSSSGGTDVCIREQVTPDGSQCLQTVFTGTSTQGSWRPDVSMLRDSTLLLSQEQYRFGTTYDPVWYNCFHPTEVWVEGGLGCRFHPFSTSPVLLGTSLWELDLAASVPKAVNIGGVIVGRYLVGITSAEDGSGFAVSTGVQNSLTGFLDDCTTQFYNISATGAAIADPTLHYYGATHCDYLYWEGGFGATRQQLTASPEPSSNGFALQARLARAVPR